MSEPMAAPQRLVPPEQAPEAPGEPLLCLQSVSKRYGRGVRLFTAVENVSLEVHTGEFVCLLGPSGCGKSTLLRIITGLQPPSEGKVLYRGKPVEGVNPYATIVFQNFALYPWLTVQENVEVALKARGIPPVQRREIALRQIDAVGLDGFESAYPRELSGGMRQKVGFARAMAVEPELLCLDEPFSALDVLSAEALRGELMELWLGKAIHTQAVLMVTHNIEESAFMSDRILVMEKNPGHVVAEVAVHLRHPRHHRDTAFQAVVDHVYAAVAGRTEPEEELLRASAGRLSPLPASRLNALAGLAEKVSEEGGRADLYRLSDDLVMDVDALLPVVESGELLGFVSVAEGDLSLTPLGQAYAEASILTRKELIAGRALRLPTIRWIYETLQRDENRRIPSDYFLDRLKLDFGDFAEEQLQVAINWGRFSELFAFDDDTDELYLES
ncbi:MAG: nitrate/sulfonate/bicarbonate ABC transporter ATP-binding protein [Anaerolineales bacterium]